MYGIPPLDRTVHITIPSVPGTTSCRYRLHELNSPSWNLDVQRPVPGGLAVETVKDMCLCPSLGRNDLYGGGYHSINMVSVCSYSVL